MTYIPMSINQSYMAHTLWLMAGLKILEEHVLIVGVGTQLYMDPWFSRQRNIYHWPVVSPYKRPPLIIV